MPRTPRNTSAGFVYQALNRGTARLTLFRKPADYGTFLRVLDEALQRYPTRLLSYCLMPTHWRFVLWPEHDYQVTQLLRWLTLTYSVRWPTHYPTPGSSHVYQNRFKAFLVQQNDHLYTVLRYPERNQSRRQFVQSFHSGMHVLQLLPLLSPINAETLEPYQARKGNSSLVGGITVLHPVESAFLREESPTMSQAKCESKISLAPD